MLTNSILRDFRHHLRYGNSVLKLIIANVLIFLFVKTLILAGFLIQDHGWINTLENKLELPASLPILIHQPWTVFTYMFMHAGLMHLLFNMLWLYWFGEIFILYLGDSKIYSVYFLGGLAGAVFYIAAFNLIPVFKPALEQSFMLGASASVLAIVFSAATLQPDHEIHLLFFGPVKIKYIALVSIVLDIINIPNGNAGGYIAHVGGALSGFLYIQLLRGGWSFSNPIGYFKPKSKLRTTHRTTEPAKPSSSRLADEQHRIDGILDKISKSGYDSLSKEEKDFLFNFSKK